MMIRFEDINDEPRTIIFHRFIKDFFVIDGHIVYRGYNYAELDALLNTKDEMARIVTRYIVRDLYEVELPNSFAELDDPPKIKKLLFTDIFPDETTSNVVKAHHYYDEEMKNTPRNFPDALKYHMKVRAMSGADLSEITGISQSTISKMINDDMKEEVRRSVKNLVAICVALKLPPKMSYDLLELANVKLLNNRQERAYSFVLDFLYQCPLMLCNGILEQFGVEQL